MNNTLLSYLGTMLPATWGLTYICNALLLPVGATNVIVGGAIGVIIATLSTVKSKREIANVKERAAIEHYNEFVAEEDEKIAHYIKKAQERISLKNDYMYMD